MKTALELAGPALLALAAFGIGYGLKVAQIWYSRRRQRRNRF